MSHKADVMVVDDDDAMREWLSAFLAVRGYDPVPFASGDEAVAHFEGARPMAVLLDLVMPGRLDGLAALAALKKIDREVPVIVVSGHGRTSAVVQAMKLGASDFVLKPFDEGELETPLAAALRQRQRGRELALRRQQLQDSPGHLIGDSPRMVEVRELIDRVADTDATVLIRGESGTGKELVAHALHRLSLRRNKPFVKVNCAALPTELLESELFGFERGAFTGALQQKAGKFEFANHGTMFLDEISEMSPALQAKLLQVLQDGEFSRLGGKSDIRVDVRVIAATNRDLERAVAQGQFREDLLFRLNVVTIALPPLRERREEIPRFAVHFLRKYSVQYNRACSEISDDTLRLFVEHDWPGNVRELENVIKRLVILGSETPVQQELARAMTARLVGLAPSGRSGSLPPPEPPSRAAAPPAHPAPPSPVPASGNGGEGHYSLKDIARTAAREAERELISRMLQHTRWNRKETAEMLGISYKALLYKIKENGLDKAPTL